jgi:hypothetical protein
VRYRLMATYRGSPFEAGVGPSDGDIVLFAACPPPEDLGFEPATGHWRKQLPIADVQAVWESRPVGVFRGERCMVLDDLGDRLHIGYLGHNEFKAEQLGYWQVDRGVFELVAPRTEVAEITEERTDYPRHLDPAPRSPGALSGGYPVPSAYPPAGGPSDTGSFSWQSEPAAPGYSSDAYSAASGPLGSAPRPEASPGYGGLADPAVPGSPAYLPPAPVSNGIAIPPAAEAPLPLEAEAMRAASESRRPRQAASRRAPLGAPAGNPAFAQPLVGQPPAAQPLVGQAPVAQPPVVQPPVVQPSVPRPLDAQTPPAQSPVTRPPQAAGLAGPDQTAPARQRRSARRRMATERLFAELAGQAGIPAGTYAVGDEVEGALCLVQTESGFEVFHAADGARHELQVFATEEAACFYLFGVLAAEAVRTGSLVRGPGLVTAGTNGAPST